MPAVCIYQRYLPPDPSGAGKQAVAIANVVRDNGWNVVFLSDGGTSPHPSLASFDVVRIKPLPLDPTYPQILAYWLRVARALFALRKRFDVLHIHTADFHHLGAAAIARGLRKGVLVRSSIQGEFSQLADSISGRLKHHMLRAADAYVLLSDRLVAECRAAGMHDALHLIPNGVDTSVYRPATSAERKSLRHDLELPLSSRILIFHGVFIPRKSLDWLIETLADTLRDMDLTLLLVGGPAREEPTTGCASSLLEQIATSPMRDRIVVRPPVSDVHRYLRASDAYVLTSTSEGLSNALLEAMAVGLVPIVSRTSGSEDVIEHGVSGFLFPPRDASAFRAIVETVFGEDSNVTLDAVSAAAAQTITSRFGIAATGRQYVRVYTSILQRSHRPTASVAGK